MNNYSVHDYWLLRVGDRFYWPGHEEVPLDLPLRARFRWYLLTTNEALQWKIETMALNGTPHGTEGK